MSFGPTPEEVKDILDAHRKWRDGAEGGKRANLYGANLVRANLYGANLVRANLDGANLDGANLVRANLDGANLDGANLYGANLDGANLDGANLYGANLDGANLYGANLDGANLDGANLYGANLYGANLVRANLYGANLVRANLDGANLYGANLDRAAGKIVASGVLAGSALDYWWFAARTETGLWVRYGCEWRKAEDWRANVRRVCALHVPTKVDQYERCILAILHLAEAALPATEVSSDA